MNKRDLNKPKKSMNTYERTVKRNQLIFILLSAFIILMMIISLIKL